MNTPAPGGAVAKFCTGEESPVSRIDRCGEPMICAGAESGVRVPSSSGRSGCWICPLRSMVSNRMATIQRGVESIHC